MEVEDGIIKREIFSREKIRLLIVVKEPNKTNHNDQGGSFIREWGERRPNYSFAHRVAELSYGILENFPQYDRISQDKEMRFSVLKRIALINVKKTGGGSTSSDKVIMNAVRDNKDTILSQIKTISPTHILFGLSNNNIIELLIGKAILRPTGWGCHAGEWNGIKVIAFYHPSARVGPAALYSFLKINFDHLRWSHQ